MLGYHEAAQLYSTASYQAHDLTGISLDSNNLAGVNLAGQNLTNASVSGHADQTLQSSARPISRVRLVSGILTGANFTGAEVRGAYFSDMTAAQLYSTASYQAHDLTGIRLYVNNLAGVNLAGRTSRMQA